MRHRRESQSQDSIDEMEPDECGIEERALSGIDERAREPEVARRTKVPEESDLGATQI